MSTLRNLRERKGLTLSQLAAKSSISSRVLTEYEEGRLPVTLAHAKLLAKALWVGIEDLMPPAGSMPLVSQPSQPSASMAPPVQAPVQTPTSSQPSVSPRPQPEPSYARPQQATVPAPAPGVQSSTPAAQDGRSDSPRPPRGGFDGREGGRPRGASDAARPARGPKPAPPPPSAISEGQVQELERLAAKLEIALDQLEERIGKRVADLTKPEAKEWIKRVRGMAEEIAPSKKSTYGQWPGGQVDHEASYLAAQKEASSYFRFKLFNGEEISGTIAAFTPYTITVNTGADEDTVLRKLAIAYYRRGAPSSEQSPPTAPKRKRAAKAVPQAAAEEESAHALEDGLSTDRVGDPETPELDRMDKDRGI